MDLTQSTFKHFWKKALTEYSLADKLYYMKDAIFGKFLETLDRVMAAMGSIHSTPLDFGTGVPLYRAEIHTVHAIGENPGVNVTKLAEDMKITKGAVSQTINKLVRKKLVSKTYARDNAKEVILNLTALGWTGFRNHQKFHEDLFEIIREHFGDDYKQRLDMFIRSMEDFISVWEKYKKWKESM